MRLPKRVGGPYSSFLILQSASAPLKSPDLLLPKPNVGRLTQNKAHSANPPPPPDMRALRIGSLLPGRLGLAWYFFFSLSLTLSCQAYPYGFCRALRCSFIRFVVAMPFFFACSVQSSHRVSLGAPPGSSIVCLPRNLITFPLSRLATSTCTWGPPFTIFPLPRIPFFSCVASFFPLGCPFIAFACWFEVSVSVDFFVMGLFSYRGFSELDEDVCCV